MYISCSWLGEDCPARTAGMCCVPAVAGALIPFLIPDLPVQVFYHKIAARAHRPGIHVWVKHPSSVHQRQNTFGSVLFKAFSFRLAHIEKFSRGLSFYYCGFTPLPNNEIKNN